MRSAILRYKVSFALFLIILLSVAPLKVFGFPEEDNEILVKSETVAVIIKKLEAMEKALTEVAESKPTAEINKVEPEIPLVKRSVLPAVNPVEMEENIMGRLFWLMAAAIGSRTIAFWLIGLALASGIGFLSWLFWRRYRLILDKNAAMQEITKLRQEITKFKAELQEKNKLLEQEEIIRKSIESTSLAREKEFRQFKLELQQEAKLLEQETKIRKAIEEKLVQKERDYEQLKNSYESLKDVLVRKGLVKELSSPEGKRGLWIPGKSEDRRTSPRLSLTKDFNNTAIVKIESRNSPRAIKCFAKDISLEGLCLETPKELDEKNPVNLRLFFYGGKIPNIKTQTRIIWKKPVDSLNCYGVSFEGLSEKVKLELGHYIESKIGSA